MSYERPWAVLISGSRDMDWKHSDLIRSRLTPLSGVPQSVLLHGAGDGRRPTIAGCDRVAVDVAKQLGLRVHGYPALWDYPPSIGVSSKAAGPQRNALLVTLLLALEKQGYRLAFLAFSTGGPGTEGMLKLVRMADETQAIGDIQIEKIDVTL